MTANTLALVATLAIWAAPFAVLAAWLIRDRRDQRCLRRAATAARDAAPGTRTQVRPDLFVVAEPRCQVVSLEARRAARRHGLGGAA